MKLQIIIIIAIGLIALLLLYTHNKQISYFTDPVIVYESPIPTNPTKPIELKQKYLTLYSFVKPNKTTPGFYYDTVCTTGVSGAKTDLLVTNGIYSLYLQPNSK